MIHSSEQRYYRETAQILYKQTSEALQPLHDDLAELTPGFDGLTYFAVDQWHENNASAVATVQPRSTDTERFAFYRDNIHRHRVDLGATALGTAFAMETPVLLQSRMNPLDHLTWAERVIIDDAIAGGVQSVFNLRFGPAPSRPASIQAAYQKHQPVIEEVAHVFKELSRNTASIGDTLELLAPTTPNAYIISWDVQNSTKHSEHHYGALRNLLLDTKEQFKDLLHDKKIYIHDTGDGQDIALYLPNGIDRANVHAVREFGHKTVLPLVSTLQERSAAINQDYTDISPLISYSVGLGYVEHDRYDGRTSQEYWQTAAANKKHPTGTIGFSPTARGVLFEETTD